MFVPVWFKPPARASAEKVRNDAIVSFKTTCQLKKEEEDLKKFWEKKSEK